MSHVGHPVRRMNEVRLKKMAVEKAARKSPFSCPKCGALKVYRRPSSGEVFCEETGCGWVFTAWEQFMVLGERVERVERMLPFLEKRVREVWQREFVPALDAEDRWIGEAYHLAKEGVESHG